MKMKIPILIIALSLTITSCKDCLCTLRGCPCPELVISIEANVDNNTAGDYTEEEIDSFYPIRTDTNYNIIDSIKLEFGYIAGNVDYNRFYRINQNKFSNFENFRLYNLLIKNTLLNSIDTIADIEYTEMMENVLCNTCINCDDQYVDCLQYSDYSLNFNGTLQYDFNLLIEK
jgi:hypothetical protein